MSAGNFAFLGKEWPDVCEPAARAESLVHVDARTSCFYARRALELAVHWLYKSDRTLRLPHSESLSALIFEPTFRDAIGSKLLTKARIIKDLGNLAVHSHKPIREADAIAALRELFHFCFWIARTYARGAKPSDGLDFNSELLPEAVPASHQTVAQLQALEGQLREKDEKLVELLEGKQALDQELQLLRKEVAAAKKANAAQPDTHDYSEAETRDYFIDLLLKEAGWALTEKRDREFPVTGMPNEKKEGFVDYVLWGDDGKPLALVEAKKTKRDARVGQQQAKLYADCLENEVRPDGPSSFTRTDISTGCGTMSRIRRAQCRDSTRRANWNCSSSGERRARSWQKQRSVRRLSSATIKRARFVA